MTFWIDRKMGVTVKWRIILRVDIMKWTCVLKLFLSLDNINIINQQVPAQGLTEEMLPLGMYFCNCTNVL